MLSSLLYGSECGRMTECDLNKLSTFLTKTLRSCVFSGLRPSPTKNVSPAVTKRAGDHHHAKAMEMDRTCHPQTAGQHHLHSPTLDIRMKTQEGTTQEHLASDCGRGAQDSTAHLGNHSIAGPEQTGVVILCY